MGRKSTHRVVKDHPSPRFAGKIKLMNFVRGPLDEGWHAQFRVDDAWTPKTPVSLSTKDWDEALEVSRDKYTLAINGHAVAIARKPAAVVNPFRQFADIAIAELEAEAIAADRDIAIGKGMNFHDMALRIRRDLIPKWGNVAIDKITEHMLNDWVRDEYRVMDRSAMAVTYGTQSPTALDRRIIWKLPAVKTLGNLDWSFKRVWDVAVKHQVVNRRSRPMIDKTEFGEDGEARSFIDIAGVKALSKLMTDAWVSEKTDRGHSVEYKRILRAYIATVAATGIRPGLELGRVRVGDVADRMQQGVPLMLIRIAAKQGKHTRARSVPVYEGGEGFPIRHILRDLIAHRRSEGAIDTDLLFGWRGGLPPDMGPGLRHVLIAAGCLTDPMTGASRVLYSFRHFFATVQIEKGLSVAQLAAWMGTSPAMIETHYNRFLIEHIAHLHNGYTPPVLTAGEIERLDQIAEAHMDKHPDLDEDFPA